MPIGADMELNSGLILESAPYDFPNHRLIVDQ